MKVIGVTTLVAKFIETDEENYPLYRRGGPEQWENLMGESWESYYDDGELEAAYQTFKKEQHDSKASEESSKGSA